MSGRKSRIWIVSELYKPSNTSTAHILAQITDFLSRDYEVLVIAGKSASFKYGLNENTLRLPNEEIKYINSPFVRGKILRLFFGLFFSIKVTIYLLRNIEQGDKILAVTNPQTLILILPYFFKKNLTFLMHDIFPENLYDIFRLESDHIYYNTSDHQNIDYTSCCWFCILNRNVSIDKRTRIWAWS